MFNQRTFFAAAALLLMTQFACARPLAEGVVYAELDGRKEFPYALYVPPRAQTEQRYPLIVALHGSRGSVDDPIRWWRGLAAERGYFICAPKSRGFSWPVGDQSHVAAIVKEVRRDYPIDPARILVTGVSDGGSYSYVLGFQYPELFTAIAPISGVLPRFYKDLSGQPKMPICVVHGSADDIFPVDSARKAVEQLKAAHYNVAYFEIARGYHGFFPERAPDILDWFEELSGPPSPQKQKQTELRLRVQEFRNAELICDFRHMARLMRSTTGGVTPDAVATAWGRHRQLTGEIRSVQASGDTATVEIFRRYGPPDSALTGARTEQWIWVDKDWFLQW